MTGNITRLRKPAMTSAERSRLHRERKRAAKEQQRATRENVSLAPAGSDKPGQNAPATRSRRDAVAFAALVVAFALASIEAFLGTVGMTAIFPGAAVPVMAMTGVLEAAKLVTAAWLARHWRVAPLALRAPLTGMVVALMVLTGVGTYGYFTRAHLAHQVEAREAIDRDAAPVAQRIALTESIVRDLDGRIGRLDDIVKAATTRNSVRTAMALVSEQERGRADLVAQRQAVAAKLADLRVQVSALEGRRAQIAGEAGPARYFADLLGWGDGETAVKLITALLVLTIDPTALLLTLALATTSRRGAGEGRRDG
jgi:hypothetical protein